MRKGTRMNQRTSNFDFVFIGSVEAFLALTIYWEISYASSTDCLPVHTTPSTKVPGQKEMYRILFR